MSTFTNNPKLAYLASCLFGSRPLIWRQSNPRKARTMLKFLCAVAAVFVASSMLGPAVHAADPGYCAHYASQAIWQFNRNRSIPGCFHGADGRWNANYDVHYGWCISAPYEAVRAEDAYRGERLHECSFRAYGHG
jgi:hypothetical protein